MYRFFTKLAQALLSIITNLTFLFIHPIIMLNSFYNNLSTNKTAAYLKVHLAVFLFGGAGLFGKLIDLPSGAIVLGRAFLGAFFVFLFSQIVDWYALKKETAPKIRTISFKQFQPKSTKDLLVFGLLGAILAFHWVAFLKPSNFPM
ncbi:MAG: hypothetical protein JKY03_07295 [Aureispira sp.]|nr:hypothetical protein [Aureispira sp.]